MTNSNSRAFGSPFRYIQGRNELDNLALYTADYGEKCTVLLDSALFDILSDKINNIYKGTSSKVSIRKFSGECSENEVNDVISFTKKYNADILIGCGGGKTIDTAKLAANALNIPFIIIPTSAASDAPVSEIAILYTEDGEYIGSRKLKNNSSLVLVDSTLIANSPKRLFVAGIADALATYFEAKANILSDSLNFIGRGYRISNAGISIAKTCYDIILEDSIKAVSALENKMVTPALENVIEANILLSGLGFQNTGVAAAHAIHSGFTVLPESHKYLHGEKVAFGIICQMILENTNCQEMDKIMNFMTSLDIPVTLEQLGVEPSEKNIRAIANKTATGSKLIYNEPFYIDEEIIFSAIYAANSLGHKYLQS